VVATCNSVRRGRQVVALRYLLLTLVLLGVSAAPLRARATCHLQQAELAVTMNGLRPMVPAKINGADALFIADSGAFYNMLTPAAAAEFRLSMAPVPATFVLSGVGGSARASLTSVKAFTLLGVTIPHVEFIVAGNDLGGGAVGLLGQNVFRMFGDVEYDLADGVIRLVRTKGCQDSPLAYWASTQHYSVIDIERATAESPHTTATAYLNGTKIRVMFDTGAATSVLTLDAAKRAGVTPESAGVVAAGDSWGIGRQLVKTWIAPFPSFRIGDEEVRNTRLRIGAIGIRYVDMLVGADFFLSHHVYVANSQRKLYFTYNGGPVFNLTTSAGAAAAPAPETPAAAAAPQDSTPGGAAPTAAPAEGNADQPGPTDASGFARRGAAFAARHDFEHAIADLTRACELAPGEASYFYQRALAHWGNSQPDPAMADFDQALKLKPDDLPSLVARADLHVRRKENPAAIADLDAAARVAPKEADVRLRLADLYLFAGQFASAVAQSSLWIDNHGREEVQMPRARNLRCWSRALWGQELDQALNDCDVALRLRPETATFLDSRGLVRLRRGEYDQAIGDYDHALSLGSKDAWSYYGRGVAKLRKGLTAEGNADIAAATAREPNIAEVAGKRGIAP
jgi:tetratricopeptide (TPR) repeat protein/predicted aspartyl protease